MRPSDWNWTVSVQHEVLPRTSVEVAFVHRAFYGFALTDNLAVGPSDFTKFSITAPQDPRLPGGGGYQVNDLYDLNNPALFGVTNNYITYADNYGDISQFFNGLDLTFSARPRNGLTVQGGFAGGFSTADYCEVREKVPEMLLVNVSQLLNPYCRIETGFLPQYKALGNYLVPKVAVSISATFTSKPGYNGNSFATPVTTARSPPTGRSRMLWCQPILGRPLAGSAAEHHREPDRAALAPGRAHQRTGPARPEGAPVREDAGEPRRGLLQPAERGPAAQLQPGVHPERRLDDAHVRAVGPLRQAEHAAGFLGDGWPRAKG